MKDWETLNIIGLSGTAKLVKMAVDRVKTFEPEEGYYLAFSGGKDSVVAKAILQLAGVKFDGHYRVTSVDPPELYNFIRDKHPDIEREIPHDKEGKPITMWNLIPRKLMPPTRVVRYCCSDLKESGGDGRMTVTGVRWSESVNRAKNQGPVTIASKAAVRELSNNSDFTSNAKGGVVLTNDNEASRRMVESCYKRHKTLLNPIIEWDDTNVWEFIRAEGIDYCGLYDDGFCRLGCIGCPMARKKGREREFLRWPKYRENYIHAFERMLQERRARGRIADQWATGLDVYRWWMEYDELPGQIDLLEELEEFS